jgi:hypothetical protein
MLEYKLVLMNKQDSLELGLAHVARRKYSAAVHIKTAGAQLCVHPRSGAQAPEALASGITSLPDTCACPPPLGTSTLAALPPAPPPRRQQELH